MQHKENEIKQAQFRSTILASQRLQVISSFRGPYNGALKENEKHG
jgi:hypothetical protein